MSCYVNPRTYMQIHTPTVVHLQWKAFDLFYKMRYILLVVALLGTCDQQWSPSWPLSWILPRIRNQGKTARDGDFL